MLNELYQLSLTLERAGITPKDWHNDMKSLPNATPKKPCYKILISSDGSISEIETMGKQLVSSLRKWQFGSNGYSFPGFNIQSLYYITGEEEKKIIEKWNKGKEQINKDKLKQWCIKENETKWNEPMLNECLGKIPQKLKKLLGEIPDNFIGLKNLFERVDKAWGKDGCSQFIQVLKNYIWEKISDNENVTFLLPILIRTKPQSENISIFLDVPDCKEFPVAHEKTIEYINNHLVNYSNSDGTKAKSVTIDAFGNLNKGFEKKLPEVKLPLISGVKLRAMSSESRCQYRYGTIDAKSFLIGDESRKRAKGSLEWMSNDEREGQTWGRADGRELIFAYPSILPPSPLKLTSCFGARKADDSEARFAKYAEDVIDSLKGLAPSLKDIDLRVFSLRKMDKARTKVVFHRNYSAQRLADAAAEWEQGCKNIPEIKIPTWGKEKGQIVHVKSKTPFPLQIADCLNRVWKLDGTTQSEVKTIHKSDGIELLLDTTANQRMVPHLLAVAIQNSKGLFCSLGKSMHQNEVLKLDGLDKHKQLMPSILGLLLWKLGIGKETYMHRAPFLVGKMFKLADEIHALYCKEVRGDNLPQQLVGNSMMTAALESPIQALSQLALRIKPYYGWAQTFRGNENSGLAGYYIYIYGEVASELAGYELPTRFNDAERAQVLLGYLAANPKKAEK